MSMFSNGMWYGTTTLMWACGVGHLDIVKVLIDNRADFNDIDKVSSGSLPLY